MLNRPLPRSPRARRDAALFLFALTGGPVVQDAGEQGYRPHVEAASEEGREALARFKLLDGLRIELVAAEPQLANPVAFTVDPEMRFYVAETFRHFAGVTDMRRGFATQAAQAERTLKRNPFTGPCQTKPA